MTTDNLEIDPELRKLYEYLVDRGDIVGLDNYDENCLRVFSREILQMIKEGDQQWETMVPISVADVIKQNSYFDYHPV